MTPPMCSGPPRAATAISIAEQASSASGCSPVAAPSSRREYRSITVARYNLPAAVGISVMSPTHLRFGASAVKSRRSRSPNFGAVLSCLVRPCRRRIVRATRPWRRMESATVFSDTTSRPRADRRAAGASRAAPAPWRTRRPPRRRPPRAAAGSASACGRSTCRTRTATPPAASTSSCAAPGRRSSGQRRSGPRSLRRLLHPQDHRALEDITLHPQLGVLRAQPLELLDVTPGQPVTTLAGLPGAGHPVAQRALVDPQVPSHLGDRPPRLLDDPDRSLTELPVVPLTHLWHRYPL